MKRQADVNSSVFCGYGKVAKIRKDFNSQYNINRNKCHSARSCSIEVGIPSQLSSIRAQTTNTLVQNVHPAIPYHSLGQHVKSNLPESFVNVANGASQLQSAVRYKTPIKNTSSLNRIGPSVSRPYPATGESDTSSHYRCKQDGFRGATTQSHLSNALTKASSKKDLRLELSSWISNRGILSGFRGRGLTCLYPWQAAALECGEDGSNLVYCAPTSGGKSLVADVLMLRRLCENLQASGEEGRAFLRRRRRKGPFVASCPPTGRALVVLPYVSIVGEKAEHLSAVVRPMLGSGGGFIKGYTGAEAGTPLVSGDEVVAICSIEKANSAVNALVRERRMHELACVVVDEAHMVADPGRGLALELLLSKIMFAQNAALIRRRDERQRDNDAREFQRGCGAEDAPNRGRSQNEPISMTLSNPAREHLSSMPGILVPGKTVGPEKQRPLAGGEGSPAASPSANAMETPLPPPFRCQVVCMSATMAGLNELTSWLHARLFMTNYRPVPLTQYAVFNGRVFEFVKHYGSGKGNHGDGKGCHGSGGSALSDGKAEDGGNLSTEGNDGPRLGNRDSGGDAAGASGVLGFSLAADAGRDTCFRVGAQAQRSGAPPSSTNTNYQKQSSEDSTGVTLLTPFSNPATNQQPTTCHLHRQPQTSTTVTGDNVAIRVVQGAGDGAPVSLPPRGGNPVARLRADSSDYSSYGEGDEVPLVERRDLGSRPSKDREGLLTLVAEMTFQGKSTLVFCAGRRACEACAGFIADNLADLAPPGYYSDGGPSAPSSASLSASLTVQLAPAPSSVPLQTSSSEAGGARRPPSEARLRELRREVLESLRLRSGGYLDEQLKRVFENGVAYHHAGMTQQERAAVEESFRRGLLHTLAATSTLAAGVNLPAARVVLRSLWQGIGPVSRAQYLQMVGRAGRAGHCSSGESYIIGKGAPFCVKSGEWQAICRLLTEKLQPIRSSLMQRRGTGDVGAPPLPPSLPPLLASSFPSSSSSSSLSGVDQGVTIPPRLQSVANNQMTITTGGLSSPNRFLNAPSAVMNAGGGASSLKSADSSPGSLGVANDLGKRAPGGEEETHLQRMLLEAIANGSVSTFSGIKMLVRSTLLHWQAEASLVEAAVNRALTNLRRLKLVSYRYLSPPPIPPKEQEKPQDAATIIDLQATQRQQPPQQLLSQSQSLPPLHQVAFRQDTQEVKEEGNAAPFPSSSLFSPPLFPRPLLPNPPGKLRDEFPSTSAGYRILRNAGDADPKMMTPEVISSLTISALPLQRWGQSGGGGGYGYDTQTIRTPGAELASIHKEKEEVMSQLGYTHTSQQSYFFSLTNEKNFSTQRQGETVTARQPGSSYLSSSLPSTTSTSAHAARAVVTHDLSAGAPPNNHSRCTTSNPCTWITGRIRDPRKMQMNYFCDDHPLPFPGQEDVGRGTTQTRPLPPYPGYTQPNTVSVLPVSESASASASESLSSSTPTVAGCRGAHALAPAHPGALATALARTMAAPTPTSTIPTMTPSSLAYPCLQDTPRFSLPSAVRTSQPQPSHASSSSSSLRRNSSIAVANAREEERRRPGHGPHRPGDPFDSSPSFPGGVPQMFVSETRSKISSDNGLSCDQRSAVANAPLVRPQGSLGGLELGQQQQQYDGHHQNQPPLRSQMWPTITPERDTWDVATIMGSNTAQDGWIDEQINDGGRDMRVTPSPAMADLPTMGKNGWRSRASSPSAWADETSTRIDYLPSFKTPNQAVLTPSESLSVRQDQWRGLYIGSSQPGPDPSPLPARSPAKAAPAPSVATPAPAVGVNSSDGSTKERLGVIAMAKSSNAPLPRPPVCSSSAAAWQATEMGRAIYESCFPLEFGMQLFESLRRSMSSGLVLAGSLHLVLLLLPDPPPLELDGWRLWADVLAGLPEVPHKRVCQAEGIQLDFPLRVLRGGATSRSRVSGSRSTASAPVSRTESFPASLGPPTTPGPSDSNGTAAGSVSRTSAVPCPSAARDQRSLHCRFASACLLHEVLYEADLVELEESCWGRPDGITRQGISRGQIQKLQSDLSKWAGMAASMAASCGWWMVEEALAALSAQAAAGARPELMPLMKLPHITGAQARALFDVGLTSPDLLAAAEEQKVLRALARVGVRGRSSGGRRAARRCEERVSSGGATADSDFQSRAAPSSAATCQSGTAATARAASHLIQAARDVVLQKAAEEEEIMLAMLEEERGDSSSSLARLGADAGYENEYNLVDVNAGWDDD